MILWARFDPPTGAFDTTYYSATTTATGVARSAGVRDWSVSQTNLMK